MPKNTIGGLDVKMNIVLIGMPSAGKSTVGKPLARMLGKEFCDTDELISAREGKTPREIVTLHGLEEFLRIQESVITSLDVDNSVIATGGSVVYSVPAMKHLKANGVIVYLEMPLSELEARIETGRKLARNSGKTFKELYYERVPLYEKYSDFTVRCSGKTVEDIVKEIVGFLDGKNVNCR